MICLPFKKTLFGLSAACFMLSLLIGLSACHRSAARSGAAADSVSGQSTLPMFKRNPEFRSIVKKEPVAEFQEKTSDRLNDLYFSVRLYETPITMQFVAKVSFEGLPGDDTIKLPDLGTVPHPVLKKGPEKYSCIIGLLDNQQQFRELKKVYVSDDGKQMKITTLRHYIVTEDYKLAGQ